jgi:hypothetical protein
MMSTSEVAEMFNWKRGAVERKFKAIKRFPETALFAEVDIWREEIANGHIRQEDLKHDN